MARLTKAVTAIRAAVSELQSEDVEGLKKIVNMCWDANERPEVIIPEAMGMTRVMALKGVMMELIQNPDKVERVKTELSKEPLEVRIESFTAKQLLNLALSVGDKVLRLGYWSHVGGQQTFKVVSGAKQLVEPLSETDRKTDREIEGHIFKYLNDKGDTIFSSQASKLRAAWLNGSTHIKDVQKMRRRDDMGWCQHRCAYEPDASVPFPVLEEVLGRLSDGEAFAAWIWGIFSGDYEGRQVIWLYGKGEEGKSFLVKTIGDALFGTDVAFKSVDNNQIKSQWLNGMLAGAKLVTYPDCNNRKALHYESVKSLAGAGRDVTVAEVKFGAPQSTVLEARLIISSNKKPHVSPEVNSTSRLMYLELAPFEGVKDPAIDKKMVKELPGFLAYGKACFEMLYEGDAIKVNDAVLRDTYKLVKTSEMAMQWLFDTYFELDIDGSVSYATIKRTILSDDLNWKTEGERFIDFIGQQPGIVVERAKDSVETTFTGISCKRMGIDTEGGDMPSLTDRMEDSDDAGVL